MLEIRRGVTMGVRRIFSRGAKSTFCLSCSDSWQCNANGLYTKRKCPLLLPQLHSVLSL